MAKARLIPYQDVKPWGQWSSHNVYVGKAKTPGRLTTDSIYAIFGDHAWRSPRGPAGDTSKNGCSRAIGVWVGVTAVQNNS